MSTPLISVIVPVFNAAAYLRRCLDSLLAQTYQKTEIILIDDGSSDGSGKICDDYAAARPKIYVFHTENQGASQARQLGLTKATGTFVSFVDSDDYVSPEYLSILFRLEQMFSLGISACQIGTTQTLLESVVEIERQAEVLEGPPLLQRFFHYEFWGLYGKLYRKQLLADTTFPKATLSEDYAVMARLLFKSPQMAYTSVPLYVYEHHPGSLSNLPLTKRSFEEFDNVHDVYLLTAAEMPTFRLNALSNAIETAVKLLWTTRKASAVYSNQRKKLKTFLIEHRKDLLSCPNLLTKTKALALFLSL